MRDNYLQNRSGVILPEINEINDLSVDFILMRPTQKVHSSRKRNNFRIYRILEQFDFFLSICKTEHNIAVTLRSCEHLAAFEASWGWTNLKPQHGAFDVW